ncbi:MAG TPA: type II secretion system protein [Candidatus Saccharimonadales bacterium]|jgi:prepilin-type N-terminal cleavage/methylation domain-containing protein
MKEQSGFTIPELMVAIVFMGFAFIAISSLYLDVQHIQEQTADVQIASHAAQTEIESLRNSNYNSLTTGQNIDFSSSLPTNLPGPRSGTVAVTSPMAGLKRVDVTVQYTDHGSQRQIELTSLIGVIGISQ